MNRRYELSTIALLRRAENEAYSKLAQAFRPQVSVEEQTRLRHEWKLAAETFLRECEARGVAKSQVLEAAVQVER